MQEKFGPGMDIGVRILVFDYTYNIILFVQITSHTIVTMGVTNGYITSAKNIIGLTICIYIYIDTQYTYLLRVSLTQ